MDLVAGQTLSHFRLVEPLGAGGMGVVWRAEDLELGRDVAIKLLSARLTLDPDRWSRLEREARVLASLNHPSIVTIHALEQAEERCFLVMELVEGDSLRSVIPPGGLGPDRCLRIALPVAEALAAAHERGIAHRDLKPANVMVGTDGRVKVLDFGLARSHGSGAGGGAVEELTTRTRSRDAHISGTLAYMSPEQLRGRPLDHRTDVFSFGVLVFEMATGRLPFEGTSTADLIAAILRDEPRPLNELNRAMPAGLGRIVARCLAKEPGGRYHAMADLVHELRDLAHDDRPAPRKGPTVAVLPFADLSREKDQDYFCEGIAEEIIGALARLEGLHVVPRTATFGMGCPDTESRQLGERLRATHLLEGSVRKADARLRISVRLIDVAEGYELWSERYDREMVDVFAIQDDIAEKVLQALRVTLLPRDRRAIRQVQTSDPEAYDYYLRGRKLYYEYRRPSVELALEMFHRAIDTDPSYARAWAGIADCCCFLFMYAGREEEHRCCADESSLKALELDPDSPEAHASRGVVLQISDRFAEAEEAFREAIRLDPRLFEAHYFYARAAFAHGMKDKAAALFEKAMAVRPEDYQAPLLVAQLYEDLGRPAQAEAARRRGVARAERLLRLNPRDTRAMYMAANGLVALGDIERGLALADRALALDPVEPMLLYNIGCIRALAGQIEPAIECLERAVASGLTELDWYRNDSNLDPLRAHPRFRTLVARLGTSAEVAEEAPEGGVPAPRG